MAHQEPTSDRPETPDPAAPPESTANTFYGEVSGGLLQTGRFYGNVIFAGGSGTPWSALGWLAASLLMSAGAGLSGRLALDRVTSLASPHVTWVLATATLLCLAATGWSLRKCTEAWRRYRSLGMRHRLLVAADHLADAVMNTWEKEEAALRLYDPKAIPVRWHAASAALQDEWATIRNRTDDEPVDLDGHFADILSTYRKLLPSGRLVVLGDPGAGKSVLAVRFLLDHLTYRSKHNPTAPVAVLLSLSSWNPDQPFWDWAANRIARDYPQLADMGGTGSSVAAQLLEKGRLLLVLDGFDELPVQARPRALDALNDRNRNTGKLLLTSRRAEYEEAVGTAGVLSAAAVIELEPLGVEDLEHFLPLTVRGKGDMGNKDDQDVSGSTDDQDVSGSTDGSSSKDGSKWAGVLDVLSGTLPAPGHDPQPEPKPESDPGAESSPDGVDLRARAAVLRQVLSTPLMVALARTAYSDTAACPRELLESKQLGTTEDVEDHLLDQFVTVVYHRPPDTHAAATDRWTADEARSRLSGLARRLQRLGLHEITWWRLSPGVPEACRLVVESAALALTLGATGWLVFGQPHRPQEPPPPYVLGVQAAACLIALLTRPLGTGDTGVAPRRLVLRGRLRAFASQAAIATAVVLPVGLAQQVTPAVLAALPVLFALRTLVDHAVDISQADSPRKLLRADRRAVTVLAPAYALRSEGPDALRSWLLAWAALGPLLITAAWHRTGGRDAVGPLVWTVSGVSSLVALGLLGVAGSAWWGFTSTRVALALTGHLPWDLASFLEDAHHRGVLRQAGGVYEFRHARLQDRLAGGPPPEPSVSRDAPLPPPSVNLVALPCALLALVVVSFTPGAAGPYDASDRYCPTLSLPAGYHADSDADADEGADDEASGSETISCMWTGDTDINSAPPLKNSSLVPIPDTRYAGSYSLGFVIDVVPPATSHSAVEMGARLFSRLRESTGAQRSVPGLGQEAVISDMTGSRAWLVTRSGNLVIQTIVTEQRSACHSTVGNIAVTQTVALLRQFGETDGVHPPGYENDPWCDSAGGTAQEEASETPEPSPSPTPEATEEETPLPTELTIKSDGTRKSHVCRGGRVEVHADEVKLTLTGDCGEVDIYGERNAVYVEHTDELGVGGNLNTVYCRSTAKEVHRETGPPDWEYSHHHTIFNCDP
ncbi:NACHT domain-containing protein [Streptomyces chartreusis]